MRVKLRASFISGKHSTIKLAPQSKRNASTLIIQSDYIGQTGPKLGNTNDSVTVLDFFSYFKYFFLSCLVTFPQHFNITFGIMVWWGFSCLTLSVGIKGATCLDYEAILCIYVVYVYHVHTHICKGIRACACLCGGQRLTSGTLFDHLTSFLFFLLKNTLFIFILCV